MIYHMMSSISHMVYDKIYESEIDNLKFLLSGISTYNLHSCQKKVIRKDICGDRGSCAPDEMAPAVWHFSLILGYHNFLISQFTLFSSFEYPMIAFLYILRLF